MVVLFSAVTVTTGDQEKEFLVRGIPRELGDIEGYTAFEEFMEDIDEETEVSVHAEAYLYGEGETYTARVAWHYAGVVPVNTAERRKTWPIQRISRNSPYGRIPKP